MRRHLVLFFRAPLLGRGKRRLAHEIGDVAAVCFERAMLALLLRRLGRDGRWHLRLAITPDRAAAAYRRRLPRTPVMAQGSGDLGQRMRRALAGCPPGPVMLVGNDIPELRADHIAGAFRVLGDKKVVFGPARDGGFWLVGVRRSPVMQPLFGPVRWSSPHALTDTLANLLPRLTVGFAATLDDVDDAAAYRRLAPRRGF